jgi:hypothetical protein
MEEISSSFDSKALAVSLFVYFNFKAISRHTITSWFDLSVQFKNLENSLGDRQPLPSAIFNTIDVARDTAEIQEPYLNVIFSFCPTLFQICPRT